MRLQLTRIALVLTLLLFATGSRADFDTAYQAYRSGDYQTAATEAGKYVEQAPENWQGHWLLGQSRIKLGRNSDGLASLRKAYDLDPQQMQVQFDLAQAYLANGRPADAASLLRQVDAASLPANAQAAYNQLLAKALAESGDRGAALAPLRQAASANPNDARAQFAFGAAAYSAGELDSAVTALGKAAELDRDNPRYLDVYVQALQLQGRSRAGTQGAAAFRSAIAPAERLVSLQPSYDNLMKLAGSQLGAKEYGAAVETYRRAAQQSGAGWEPHFYMGQAYTVQSQYANANAALQQAMSAAQGNNDAQRQIWRQLGFVHEKQEAYDESIRFYQQAGDSTSVARVQQNKEVREHNVQVEAEERRARELREEEERLERELRELPGGRPRPDADDER